VTNFDNQALRNACPFLSADKDTGGALPTGPSRTEYLVSELKTKLAQLGLMLEGRKYNDHPAGFISLPDMMSASHTRDEAVQTIRKTVQVIMGEHHWNRPSRLDVQEKDSVHAKVYAGIDYRDVGPVLVNPTNLAAMFPGFSKPSVEEIAARVAVGKEIYGTMPGIEAAYTGAMIKAMQPCSVLIIGEHRGALTDYVARCTRDDCVIVTIDLPRWMSHLEGVAPLDEINQIYRNNCTDEEIGSIWRTSDAPYANRIIGFAGDSTHDHTLELYVALRGLCDVVIVDGNHSYDTTMRDLKSASRVVSPGGIVFVDDFWKPMRLYEVTRAVMNSHAESANLQDLYHLSWAVGEDAIQSNLAFFLNRKIIGRFL